MPRLRSEEICRLFVAVYVPDLTRLVNWRQAAGVMCRTGPVRSLVSRIAIRGLAGLTSTQLPPFAPV